MGWMKVGAALAVMVGGAVVGCGGGGEPGPSSGGAAGSSAGSGGGAGQSDVGVGGTAGAGGSASSGTAGVGASGGAADPGLSCKPTTPMFGKLVPISVNGKCLSAVGEESGGARILSRTFRKTSVLADASGEKLFVTDAAILPEPDPLGNEVAGPPRIAVVDRVSADVLSESTRVGRPYLRAVSATHIAWLEVGTEGKTLEAAPLAESTIGASTSFGEISVRGDIHPFEQMWFEADQLYYEEQNPGWGKLLRRVPVAGGMETRFEGVVNAVVDMPRLLGFGSLDSSDEPCHLLRLQEGAAPTVLREAVLRSHGTLASFVADATYAYILDHGVLDEIAPLLRVALDGKSAPEKLAEYPDHQLVASSGRGFVQYDHRYLWLVPVSGAERIRLADLGPMYSIGNAVLTAKHLFVIVDGDSAGPSSYLLEIALPG